MTDHQRIARRMNGRTPRTRPMANPPRRSRVTFLIGLLAVVSWSAHCYATAPLPQPMHVKPPPMGAPGTTATDWREGTFSDNAQELDIDLRRCTWCKSQGKGATFASAHKSGRAWPL